MRRRGENRMCLGALVAIVALIAATLLGSAGVVLCRDDEDEVPGSQR